jgi:multimeric flavodoxin WrbA
MAKKIVAILGSPRKKGLTNTLLSVFKENIDKLSNQEGVEEDQKVSVEILNLVDYKINHCTACDLCLRRPNECPLTETDDMAKIETMMKDADAILVGSPSYFYNVPGILKDLIDRSRPMKMAKYQLKDKFFSVITTAGLQGGGFTAVNDSLIHWALIQGMIVISALGHPVIVPNFPSESGQMLGVKEFRKPSEPGEVSTAAVEALAKRFWNLLK